MLSTTSVNRPAVNLGQANYNIYLPPLVERSPLTRCEACVIVPVRNEAIALEATLLALTNQVDLTGKPLDKNCYEIIVLANNCTDNSAEIARNFARTQSVILHVVEMTIEGDRAHVGWVRKLLMDEAYRRLKSIGRNLGVIASTDGDTKVSPTWIAATLAEIKNGADAVGGRIITDSQERSKLDKATRLYYLRHLRYGYLSAQLEAYIDPDNESCPRHHHHYGASLAVTAQIYAKVGGLPPLRSSEDVALYEALKRIDARFRHSLQVRVITSARSIGRAEAGLSARLSQLKNMAQNCQSVLVESAELIKMRFYLRRWLRYLWQSRQTVTSELSIVARKIDLKRDVLEEAILRASTFGSLLDRIEQYQQHNNKLARGWQPVTIQQANAEMEIAVNSFKRDRYFSTMGLSLDALEQIEPISLLPQPL